GDGARSSDRLLLGIRSLPLLFHLAKTLTGGFSIDHCCLSLHGPIPSHSRRMEGGCFIGCACRICHALPWRQHVCTPRHGHNSFAGASCTQLPSSPGYRLRRGTAVSSVEPLPEILRSSRRSSFEMALSWNGVPSPGSQVSQFADNELWSVGRKRNPGVQDRKLLSIGRRYSCLLAAHRAGGPDSFHA